MTGIGIMQGRLLPPQGGRIQAFPAGAWAEEFPRAAAVPLDAIEWIYEVQGSAENPLATDDGQEHMLALSKAHGVAIRSVCADYFMDRPFLAASEQDRARREEDLAWLLHRCQGLKIQRVVLPLLESSRIQTGDEFAQMVAILRRAAPVLDRTGVELHLETDLAPGPFANLLAALGHPKVRVTYDSGNSASLGYQIWEEFAAYGELVGSVHIKDRVRGSGSVPLGTGDVDFASLFAELRRVRYAGDFILQVARGTPGEECNAARENRDFIARKKAQILEAPEP